MDLLTLFKLKFSFQNLLPIIIIFTIFIDKTLSLQSKISSCAPQNCGNGPLIRYPFWNPQFQEPHCGSSGFNVTCSNNNPVLKISGDDYIIKDIFYTNHSFLLASPALYDSSNTCPTPKRNFSLDTSPFLDGPSLSDLFFFYNCTAPPDNYATYWVDCASNSTQHSFAVYHVEVLESKNYSIESCQSTVNAPVDGEDIAKLLKMNFTDVLKKGFVLQWSGDDCKKCEKTGGLCESYDGEFFCSCNGQPYRKTCDDGRTSRVGLKIGIGFGAAGGAIIFMCLIFYFYHRRNKKYYAPSSLVSRDISSYPSSVTDLEKAGTYMGVQIFTYIELEEATNNFDTKKELGDGGFGTVYLGKLNDGRNVAVKRLYENNFKRVEQFMNEVEILTHLRHPNLVTLYGCTSRHCRELLLVYEYIPNGTVADHLHGERRKPDSLPWNTRMSIAIETASALTYLHASVVVHRDVKTNNILLDNSFSVKVADFGLSRLFPINVTHVSTAPQGTPGYVDPEYHQCYQLTDKSDVFSFGVVLVELISSMPAVDITRHRHEINLSNMAINKIQSGALHELVDKNLGFESDYKVNKMITQVAELAFQCLQNGKDMRPSMEEVLNTLKKIQTEDNDKKKGDEEDKPTEVVVLLKNDTLTLSPDSVTTSWMSTSTTSNVSH